MTEDPYCYCYLHTFDRKYILSGTCFGLKVSSLCIKDHHTVFYSAALPDFCYSAKPTVLYKAVIVGPG